MSESMTVTVGLDVHARSIRLAAVRADELLEERTLPYEVEAVERVLRGWPVVRCSYEAGPTGIGLCRHLVEQGFDCRVVAGLVSQRPGERVKTDLRDARKLARVLAGGLLEPIHVPSPEQEAALSSSGTRILLRRRLCSTPCEADPRERRRECAPSERVAAVEAIRTKTPSGCSPSSASPRPRRRRGRISATRRSSA
jgi:hypothetical protein